MGMAKNKQVQIESTLVLLNAEEVLQYLPNGVVTEIKEYDPTPMFVMLTVGHTGESTGALYNTKVDEKQVWYKQLWPLKAVKQLVSKLKDTKVPIYTDVHSLDANANRPIVGYVLASTKKIINDATHAVGIAYISDVQTREKLRSRKYDVCSIEATCLFSKVIEKAAWLVDEVKNIMGVVLFNSQIIKPGFKDASIHAVVMAMSIEQDDDDDTNRKGSKNMEVTLEDVKKFIESKNLKATDLFSIGTITKEPQIIDVFVNEQKIATQEKEARIKALETELTPFKVERAKLGVTTKIKTSALLKDVPKKQVEYLEKTIKLDADAGAITQEQVDAAVKEQLDIIKELGIEFAKDTAVDNDPAGKEGGLNKGGPKVPSAYEDYAKVEYNPLIPV